MNQKLKISSTLIIICLLAGKLAYGQFHTMKIPQASNYVTETQRLAVTDITLTYHSPATRGRDVWNNPNVIPQNGTPIPWRAGANMNTTITFSTDVSINGNPLKSGTYGLHIVPRGDTYEILFAHASNQWGSYYLDLDKDVTLTVNVMSDSISFSEKLDYEFVNWQENKVTIGLEWGHKRIPFEVSVDLNQTVIASFREELRGINTYRWQAWNDAARWCLQHDTNLPEALEWAERSIEGGYNGFAANKNASNLQTKAELLLKLNRQEALKETIEEAINLGMDEQQTNYFSIFLLRGEMYQEAVDFLDVALKQYDEAWYLHLNRSIAYYFLGNKKTALKMIAKTKTLSPASFSQRLDQIEDEIRSDSYQLPGSRS
jgi:tetratricopeptide (TPR) repeat protein